MKLIVGLGNSEEQFKDTRHNAGFRLITLYSQVNGFEFKLKDKFKACVAEQTITGEKVIFIKPTTYYNLSGQAVHLVSDFYKIEPFNVLIIHDELALPFGTVRTRDDGSDAGNNGIKSVSELIGPQYARIRVGILNELRERMDAPDFVLSKFSKDEKQALEGEISTLVNKLIDSFIKGEFPNETHKI